MSVRREHSMGARRIHSTIHADIGIRARYVARVAACALLSSVDAKHGISGPALTNHLQEDLVACDTTERVGVDFGTECNAPGQRLAEADRRRDRKSVV